MTEPMSNEQKQEPKVCDEKVCTSNATQFHDAGQFCERCWDRKILLAVLASTEPEQPASEARKKRLMEASARVNDFARRAVLDLADRLDAVANEPSTTERETEYRPWEYEGITELEYWKKRYLEVRMEFGDGEAQEPPTAPGKKWTPAALEEWTPEQWAGALDAARTDLMCAEDFEPSDVAHVMNICAQVLRRPREQGERHEGWVNIRLGKDNMTRDNDCSCEKAATWEFNAACGHIETHQRATLIIHPKGPAEGEDAHAELKRIGPQVIEEMEQYDRYVAAGKPGNDYRAWLETQKERDHG